MFEVTIRLDFNSAHRLTDYHGQCENVHGHNWRVELTVARNTLDTSGMVLDFKELMRIMNEFISLLDHQYLNELPWFDGLNPTAEHIALVIYRNVAPAIEQKSVRVKKIEVWETDWCSASYSAE